jgi:hypothetical protein
MGQKTHPIGFRLGVSKDWKSRYYAGRELPALLREDELLRKYLKARLGHDGDRGHHHRAEAGQGRRDPAHRASGRRHRQEGR